MFVNVTDARRIIRPIRRDCFAVCRCFLSFVNVCFTSKRQIRVSRRDCFVVCRCFLLTFVNVCFAQISFCSNLPFSFTRTMLDTTTCLSMFDKYTAFVLAKRIVNLRYDKMLTHFIKGDVSFASSIETFQRKDNNRCNFRSHPWNDLSCCGTRNGSTFYAQYRVCRQWCHGNWVPALQLLVITARVQSTTRERDR